ncbi:hypothetical protein AGABI1DRAFT_49066 [Agaricus bisporus var. burnettii JB137-S8]|uniref:Homing endonuclease LAGLIDADG domain-containing protein n=1 Tax=Agaricus bisporus var. burnettii (strain JB137-S8 / ATCC MYA-4627 / FGSC 10392) TaxID=597362 RepID=K5WSX6_AGABU|nr:uncharacterized protein AGABI1DRAFT_49066 [Agaricus bisporus var. burnettii JB137-S8]EKM73853.1 hypothetical protein AGABI1DRAFT_49066 [Agaricus bisporus var. burnettii JB137-S8]
MIPFNKARTKAKLRIGPHNKEVLDVLICGMLGDFWADKIPGNLLNSTRIQLEQSISNAAYIHYLSLYFYELGYCARPIPTLIKKTEFKASNLSSTNTSSGYSEPGNEKVGIENRFNYRLTLFTFTNWSLQKGQGVFIATNSFTYEDCKFLALTLTQKYQLKTSVVKSGKPNQWRLSIFKESMPRLAELVGPHFIPEMEYKLKGYL